MKIPQKSGKSKCLTAKISSVLNGEPTHSQRLSVWIIHHKNLALFEVSVRLSNGTRLSGSCIGESRKQ